MATTKGWSISGTTATYYDENGTKAATLTGLKSGLQAVADDYGVYQIDGIGVEGTTFTLNKKVLTNTDVTLTNTTDTKYSLELTGSYSVQNNGGWVISGTTADLMSGTSSGYAVSEDDNTIKYTAAKPGTKVLATLTGLKEGISIDKDSSIAGITVSGTTVTINSKSVLGGGDVTIDNGYKLVAGDNLKALPTGDGTWTVPKDTTASFTTATSESYTLDKTGTKLTHVAAGSATVTLSGLAKGTTAEKLNSGSATVSGGTITLKSDVLGTSKVTLKGADYKLALNEDDDETVAKMATKEDPVWNKKAGDSKATYDQVFSGKGKYYCDGTTISTLSKDTQTVTLATLTGLDRSNGDVWSKNEDDKQPDGIEVEDGVITLSNPDLFTTSNITLGKNDAYSLAVTSDFDVYTSRLHWDYDANKGGTAKIVRTTEAGYEQKDSKTVNYLKSTSTTLATVSGLAKGLSFTEYKVDSDKDDESTTDVAETGTIAGLTFDPSKGTITVEGNILTAGDTVLDRTTGKKGVKKLTLGAKDAYTFTFGDEVKEPENQDAVWKLGYQTKSGVDIGKGTWTYSQDTTDGWAIDTSTKGASKTINYNAAKTTTLAELSGVTTSLDFDDVDENYVIKGDNITADYGDITVVGVIAPTTDSEGNKVKGKIVLNEMAFAGKKISLKGSDYTIGLDNDYGVKDITEEDATWVADTKGKAVLTGGKSAGYEVDAKTSLAINYTAPKVTAYATITGLKTSTSDEEIAELGEALEANTDKKAKTITLTDGMMPVYDTPALTASKTKVALGAKDSYKFVLDTTDIYEPEDDPSWKLEEKSDKLTGNALYNATMSDGYLLKDDKTVNFKVGGNSTIFTLSGLSKEDGLVEVGDSGSSLGYYLDGSDFIEAITVDIDKKKVTLIDDAIFGGTKISLKNGADNYALEVGDDLKDGNLSEPAWNISGGKAIYYEGTSGGYATDTKGTSASYTKPKATKTLVEITGLSKNVSKDTSDNGFTITGEEGNKKILITGDAVTTSAIKLTKGDGYKLSLYGVEGPQITDSEWVKKDGTANATITRATSAGWTTTSDGKTINYNKEKSETLVTVSGLKKSVTAADIKTDKLLTLDAENKTVTVLNGVLDNAKVTIKGGTKDAPYTLVAGKDVVTTTSSENYWTVSGGKATYYTGNTPHYTLGTGNLSLEYKTYKADATLATVSGLKKTASESDFELSKDGVITLKSTALDQTTEATKAKTNVTLKGDGYSLALDEEDPDITIADIDDVWGSVKSGKILYERSVTSDGYMISADKKAVSYGVKGTTKSTTLATLNGISDNATPSKPDENGVITLDTNDLAGKKAYLNAKDPYTLALDNVAAPTAGGTWEVKNGTATLKGKKTAGYLKTDDKTANYTKASTNTETLATIKGVTSETVPELTEGSTEVDLSSVTLSNNVTADGKGILAFDFGSHKDATIIGSSSNDSLKFAGSGLTINPSKGNDYIDLGSSHSGADTLLYASGDGYDIVDGFKSTDKITVSKAKSATIKKEDADTVVTIDNKGSITLKNFSGTPTIEGVTVTTASSDLLIDDNYSMDAAALSEIVTANTGSYSPYQFSNSLKLTKEENFLPAIAYASDKK